jgi:hypothetical protein
MLVSQFRLPWIRIHIANKDTDNLNNLYGFGNMSLNNANKFIVYLFRVLSAFTEHVVIKKLYSGPHSEIPAGIKGSGPNPTSDPK